ncbi:hypothetical protein PIB30_022102 [Stylosanthes scabra]|uniref:Uncharacterized protein n=1 Tax=Stylosanthes scabra TaxID=79078 RepID=A0ABU6S942_9FABA|nr:hypothetical protein [Stylosanthes scabra]
MHAAACCAHARLEWGAYVHDVYRMSEVFNVYRLHFAPPIPEGYWPPYGGPIVIPYPNMRRARAVGHGRLGSGLQWMTPTQTDLDAAVCVGRRATPGRLVFRDVPRLRPFLRCLLRSLYWTNGLRWSYLSLDLFMENAATYFKSSNVHEDYHYLKYRRQVSFLNCLIHPFPNGSIYACSRNHVQTAHLFHSNHMSQSYLYHLTVNPIYSAGIRQLESVAGCHGSSAISCYNSRIRGTLPWIDEFPSGCHRFLTNVERSNMIIYLVSV